MNQVATLARKYWIVIAVLLFLFGTWLASFFTGKSPKKKVFKDVDESKSNMTDEQASHVANRLFDAMDDPTTYFNDEIIDILKPLGKADLKKVYDQFGQRHYDTILKGEGGWLFNDRLDLFMWLDYEVKGDLLIRAKTELAHLEIF
ncbi:hypothetical protein [Flagellimonas sp.]|uniref:hypothetical protein n=1 Tax=Flagellimonas sp. TaxID=2058762 RepID=UPI003BA87996